MAIVSLPFAGLVLVVLVVFYLLPARMQRWWLLLASYGFYSTFHWQYPVLLIGLTAVNFGLALPRWRAARAGRVTLLLSVAINLAVLAYFKSIDALQAEAVEPGSFTGAAGLALPIGLSFYLLQAISYQVDVRRGQAPAASFVGLALYLGYFPKLLAGPLERARTFLPQLSVANVLDDERLARAVTLIIIGLVRKAVIADPLAAMIPKAVFEQPDEAEALFVWLAAYSLALYNDFAGYTSIVRGVSTLFGIELSPNFSAPFFARSFTEFWNRWHISLSQWLRDYLYLPLSRGLLRRNPSINNVPNILIPPMVAMLASGLWHGSGWHMLLWGGLHGTYLVLERIVSLLRRSVPIQRRSLPYRMAAASGVFVVVIVTNVFFRLSVTDGLHFLQAMVTPAPLMPPDPRVIALIGLGFAIDWVQWRSRDEAVFLSWPLAARSALLAGAILAVAALSQGDASVPFVYQGF